MNKDKKIIIGLVIIIIILVIGGIAFYTGKKSNTFSSSVTENNLPQASQNNIAFNQVEVISYKTPCEMSAISKEAFSFSYPKGFSVKETKPLEGNVPGGGILNTEIKPKDGGEAILINFPFESCEYIGYKLCKSVGDGYVIVTNNSNSEVVSAYNEILSTIKLNKQTDCEKSTTNSDTKINLSNQN